MMRHQKLIQIRKAKGLSQTQMATAMTMEQTTYSKKEREKSPIINDEWNRFAKVLDVSVEEIKVLPLPMPSKHENQVLNNRPASTNYINIPQNVFDIIINYNHKLELENQKLKNEIKVLR